MEEKKTMETFLVLHFMFLWAQTEFFFNAVAIPSSSTKTPLYIKDGESLNITCEVVQDAAQVTWNRNGFGVLQIRNTTHCSFIKLSLDTYNYSVTCDQRKRFSMVKYGFNRSDDNTMWSCQVDDLDYNDLGTSSGIRVYIYIPVDSVQLKNGTTLTLIENQSASLVCETAAGRPSAAIYWMKNGVNITDSPTTVTLISVGSEMFISIGTLNYTGQRGDNQRLLTCGAYNGLGSVRTSANLTITIYYPPSIEVLISPYKVIENQVLNMTCVVTSNPPADLIFWSPRGEGSVNSTLYFSSVSRNKSGTYSCTAQNTMTPTVGTQQIGTNTSQIQVAVLYPPYIQGLKSLYKVIEKQPLNVTCEVNSNPPADQISWSPRGEGSVPSILFFQSISRTISGIYSCTAQNTMRPTSGTQQNGKITSQMQVDVLYSPVVNFTSPVKVIQGQPLEVVCIADGNPPPQVSWYPAGEDTVNKSRLYYSAISMDKAGVHTCTATNNMVPTTSSSQTGIGYKELLINVLCIPCVPQNVIAAVNGPDSVTLEWTSGIDFVHPQEFVIQYRIYPDGAWVALDPIKETGSSKQSITIGYLQHKTTYEFSLQALNIKGPSDNISVIVTTTEIKECAFPVGAVVGSISGTLVACVCVVVVIIFLQQKRQRKERRGDTYESVDTAGRSSDKINTYDSLSHDKTESSGDIAYENTGAAISHGPVENITRPRDENMEMRSQTN